MDKEKFQEFCEKLKIVWREEEIFLKRKLSPLVVLKIVLTSDLSFLKKIIYLIPSKIFVFKERENLILKYRVKEFNKTLDYIFKNNEFRENPFFKIIEERGSEFSSNMFNFSMIILNDQYCVNQFIKEGDVVFDIGANIGFFSLLAAFKGARVFSFEPVFETYKRLLKNIKYFNAEKDVFAYPSALGDFKRESLIKFNINSSDRSTIIDSSFQQMGNFILEKINIITMDDFIKENKIKKIDFIKIDTEGYELKILKGAKNTIQKFKPKIAISAYHKKEDKKEIPHFLLRMRPDYQYKLINRGEEVFLFF